MMGTPEWEGYERWTCDICTASCTYEAMTMCARRENPTAECGFENDKPEALEDVFEFVIKKR
jgi:hypothetical protein